MATAKQFLDSIIYQAMSLRDRTDGELDANFKDIVRVDTILDDIITAIEGEEEF